MRTALIAALLLAVVSGCPKRTEKKDASVSGIDATVPTPEARTPSVPKDAPLYDRVEGTGAANQCGADTDCKKGGCSGEVCSAQADIITTCEVQPWPQGGDSRCGCVESQCIWYRLPGSPASGGAAQGASCQSDGKCAASLTCVEYYGIAGPRGPKFASCEIPCADPTAKCPDGQTCITIADGPGRVCRPAK